MSFVYRSDQAFGPSLERLEAPPLDHALRAANNEAFSVLCRPSAQPRVSYAGLEAWRSDSYRSRLGIGYRGVGYTEKRV